MELITVSRESISVQKYRPIGAQNENVQIGKCKLCLRSCWVKTSRERPLRGWYQSKDPHQSKRGISLQSLFRIQKSVHSDMKVEGKTANQASKATGLVDRAKSIVLGRVPWTA